MFKSCRSFFSGLSSAKYALHSPGASVAHFSYLLTRGGVNNDPTSQASIYDASVGLNGRGSSCLWFLENSNSLRGSDAVASPALLRLPLLRSGVLLSLLV